MQKYKNDMLAQVESALHLTIRMNEALEANRNNVDDLDRLFSERGKLLNEIHKYGRGNGTELQELHSSEEWQVKTQMLAEADTRMMSAMQNRMERVKNDLRATVRRKNLLIYSKGKSL